MTAPRNLSVPLQELVGQTLTKVTFVWYADDTSAMHDQWVDVSRSPVFDPAKGIYSYQVPPHTIDDNWSEGTVPYRYDGILPSSLGTLYWRVTNYFETWQWGNFWEFSEVQSFVIKSHITPPNTGSCFPPSELGIPAVSQDDPDTFGYPGIFVDGEGNAGVIFRWRNGQDYAGATIEIKLTNGQLITREIISSAKLRAGEVHQWTVYGLQWNTSYRWDFLYRCAGDVEISTGAHVGIQTGDSPRPAQLTVGSGTYNHNTGLANAQLAWNRAWGVGNRVLSQYLDLSRDSNFNTIEFSQELPVQTSTREVEWPAQPGQTWYLRINSRLGEPFFWMPSNSPVITIPNAPPVEYHAQPAHNLIASFPMAWHSDTQKYRIPIVWDLASGDGQAVTQWFDNSNEPFSGPSEEANELSASATTRNINVSPNKTRYIRVTTLWRYPDSREEWLFSDTLVVNTPAAPGSGSIPVKNNGSKMNANSISFMYRGPQRRLRTEFVARAPNGTTWGGGINIRTMAGVNEFYRSTNFSISSDLSVSSQWPRGNYAMVISVVDDESNEMLDQAVWQNIWSVQ